MSAKVKYLSLLSVFLGGFSAIGWELLWQLKASLAIGVSAKATAEIIAATMGGMTAGTIVSGLLLRSRRVSPYLLYALLELSIGAVGLLLGAEFDLVKSADQALYRAHPYSTSAPHLLLIAAVIGPPAMAMGASVPVFGLIAKPAKSTISLLYGLNTLGACIGVLTAGFLVLPAAGIAGASYVFAAGNAAASLGMFALWRSAGGGQVSEEHKSPAVAVVWRDHAAVFLSGFAIFALEVAWFRALRAAFLSTSQSFAIMLAAVLLALAIGAHVADDKRGGPREIEFILVFAVIAIALTTPILERMDIFSRYALVSIHLARFLTALACIAPVAAVLSVIFPMLLEKQRSTVEWALLHSSNTAGAFAGALGAAWFFLPHWGILGTMCVVAGILLIAVPIFGARAIRSWKTYAAVVA